MTPPKRCWWCRERRRAPSVAPVQSLTESAGDWDEASLALTQTSGWIRSADTKAGFAVAALTFLLGVITDAIASSRRAATSVEEVPWTDGLYALAVVLVVIALGSAIAVISPRTKSPEPNRFSWPWLASVGEDEVLKRIRTDGAEAAWLQARVQAQIARKKYRWLRIAVTVGSIAAAIHVFSSLRTMIL